MTNIEAGTAKTDTKKKLPEVYPEIDEAFFVSTSQHLDVPSILNEIYTKTLPMIKKIIRKYIKLDATAEVDDFLHQAYLALYDAMIAYRQEAGDTKFSTVFIWYLQKSFEKLCPMNERQVEIIYAAGASQIISYKRYLKIKRTLPENTNVRVMNRYVSLNQIIEDEGERKYGYEE